MYVQLLVSMSRNTSALFIHNIDNTQTSFLFFSFLFFFFNLNISLSFLLSLFFPNDAAFKPPLLVRPCGPGPFDVAQTRQARSKQRDIGRVEGWHGLTNQVREYVSVYLHVCIL